ncbi:MAG TPA: radical SAM protein [Candidatus Omnitrophica bacterium]|nr:radical SAM protein [Candidatus Omnitrophota bacterium]
MRKKLDLLLVNPSNRKKMYGELSSSLSAIEPPLWTGLIASFIRAQGFSAKIIDAAAENLGERETVDRIFEEEPLLVGIGLIGANPSASSTPKMPAVRQILNLLKEKNPEIKVGLYGIHPSALPFQTLREEKVDFIFRGEAFYTILKTLKFLKFKEGSLNIPGLWYKKDGEIVDGGWGKLVENLDELPFAAWDLLPMQNYRAHNWHCFGRLNQRDHYAVIYTSLGCPFNCKYCNIHTLYNGKPLIRYRSPEKVVEEIDFLVKNYQIKNLKIIDEIFVLNEERVLKICDLIIKGGYDLNIWAYARIDTVSEKLLRKMKEAGINWLCFGIESASSKVRESVGKVRITQEKIKKAIEATHKAGIYVIGNFMFGLPDDDFESMSQTLELAKELNLEYVNFYTAMAYPGSQLYLESVENKLPLPSDWAGYSQLGAESFPLSTKYLSNIEVLRFRDQAFSEYYNRDEYFSMIEEKFGPQVVEHIKDMLKYKIRRSLLQDSKVR